jgi:sugar lactone lactonase YvrE
MSRIADFVLKAADFGSYAQGLRRPECIIAEPDGTLFVSDNPDGVLRISPDGGRSCLGAMAGVPNGHAMDADRNLIVTDIENGLLWKIGQDGRQEIVLRDIAGVPLGAVNFVMIDSLGATWVTVSTRTRPRSEALSQPRADGYIIKIDSDGPRIVADGIYFTNEIRIDRTRSFLYVAETARGRILRLPLDPAGLPGAPQVFGPATLFSGARVDGITFDEKGNLWVTEITRNAIYVIEPTGLAHCVFQDPQGLILRVPTSITFGGPDLRTAYVGSLAMDTLMTFKAPFSGEPLSHWPRPEA